MTAIAISGGQLSHGTNFQGLDFVLEALSPRGAIVRNITLSAWGDTNTALTPFASIEPATWLVWRVGSAAQANPSLVEAPKMEAGIVSSQSRFLTFAGTPEANYPPNPAVLASDRFASGIGSIGDVSRFQLQPGLAWYLPSGASFRFAPNSRATGGTLRGEVSITWEEPP